MPYLLLLLVSLLTMSNYAIANPPQPLASYKVILDTRAPLTKFRQLPYGSHGHGISGSAQFNQQGYDKLRTKLAGKDVTIVDLREESHIHINGFTLYLANVKNSLNEGKSVSEISMIEKQLVADLRIGPMPPLYLKVVQMLGEEKQVTYPPTTLDRIISIMTEADLVTMHTCFSYERLPVTDTTKLTDATIDRLVELKLAAARHNTWLHCHCVAGQGRTSQALAVWCMMEEAKANTLAEIFTKLESLGNRQLLTGEARRHPREYWQHFHSYCVAEGWKVSKWSEWKMIRQ